MRADTPGSEAESWWQGWARSPWISRLVCCSAMALCATAGANELLPAKLRAAFLLRALSYEKTFASERGVAPLLVISGGPGAADAEVMSGALQAFMLAGAARRPMVLANLDLSAATADELARRRATVILVPAGNRDVYPRLAGLQRTIVLCSDPSDVLRGCMVSVELAGKTARLVIDVARTGRAHLRFDARLLGLARVPDESVPSRKRVGQD